MEAQFRRGILDACVLAVLERGESYGYQMVKDIKTFIDITESTLYPILKRLENANMLTVFTQEHNGRLRKYYAITPLGLARLEDFKREWKELLSIYRFVTKEGHE